MADTDVRPGQNEAESYKAKLLQPSKNDELSVPDEPELPVLPPVKDAGSPPMTVTGQYPPPLSDLRNCTLKGSVHGAVYCTSTIYMHHCAGYHSQLMISSYSLSSAISTVLISSHDCCAEGTSSNLQGKVVWIGLIHFRTVVRIAVCSEL